MAAAVAEAKPVWLFYHVQNDRGETGAHPNAARIVPATPGRVSFADVIAAFPLVGTGAFHFRFQVALEKQLLYLDVSPPGGAGSPAAEATPVPTVNGNVIAKVLRLDTLKSSAGRAAVEGIALRPRPGWTPAAPQQRPPTAIRAGGGPASSAASSAGTPAVSAAGSGVGRGASGGASTPAAAGRTPVAAPPPAFMMPAMATGGVAGSHLEVPKEVDGDTHIRDTGQVADIYAKLKQADERGMRPVKAIHHDTEVHPDDVPDSVDADLEGKSDFVKAKVMARRAEIKRAQEARLAEVAAREASAADENAQLEAAKVQHAARIKEWALEPSGQPRNLRVLLTGLPTVLWEGAKWEPVPMAKLVVPSKVKVFFMKAVTVVHPDKAAGMDVEKRYVAGQVFHHLEAAWRNFQDTELNV